MGGRERESGEEGEGWRATERELERGREGGREREGERGRDREGKGGFFFLMSCVVLCLELLAVVV